MFLVYSLINNLHRSVFGELEDQHTKIVKSTPGSSITKCNKINCLHRYHISKTARKMTGVRFYCCKNSKTMSVSFPTRTRHILKQ